MEAFGWSEHPLGHGLFIYAMFSKSTYYDVFFPSGNHRLDYIVPTSYSNAYDSITGKRLESVQQVVRYPDHLAITVVNNINGHKRYFILDKNFNSKKIIDEQIIGRYLFESSDSALLTTGDELYCQPN